MSTNFRARHYDLDQHWDQVHSLQEALNEAGIPAGPKETRSFVIRVPKNYRNAEDYRKLLENGILTQAYKEYRTTGDVLDFQAALKRQLEVALTSPTPESNGKHANTLWEELERKLEQISRDAETLNDTRFQNAILTAKRVAGSHLI